MAPTQTPTPMMSSLIRPYVVAGSPIRNRAWVARRHALSLAAQTRRPDSLLYVINGEDPIEVPDPESPSGSIVDRTPSVHALLSTIPEWMAPGPSGLEPPGERRFLIEKADIEPSAGDQRYEDPARGLRRYSSVDLAALRNFQIERFLAEFPMATHLWSVDSDVIPNPDVLDRLLAVDVPIIGALVPASASGTVYTFMCGWEPEDPRSPRRDGREPLIAEVGAVHRATLVGACVLIRRDVLERGVRYADAPKCEDEGFAISALGHGYQMFINGGARCRHAQPDGTDWD